MPKKAVELGALQVSRLVKPGRYAVGGVAGLHLWVKESGMRSWVLRVVMGKARKDIGLGGFPDVTLAGARESSRRARDLIVQGIDPVEQRRQARALLMADSAKAKTFEQCTAAYIEAKGEEWRNPKHRQQWENTLKTYADPVIGRLMVRDIALAHVLDVLQPIWRTKTETAVRVRGRIETVLDWATARGYRTGLNPARWKGHLEQMLPKPSKVSKVVHHGAVGLDDPPDFALTCSLLFTIDIGKKSFPMDVDALDAWMAENNPAPESRAAYDRKRAAAIAAFGANDMDATGEALEDMHQLVHMLRALPLAHAGAKAKQSQSIRRRGKEKLSDSQQRAIVRAYEAAPVKYGTIKALAGRYDVSDDTIRAVLSREKRNSIPE